MVGGTTMNTLKTLATSTLLISALGAISIANAATIDFNYTPTSSLFTANDGTQTEWLHLSESTNYSYNQIITELGTGGAFDGYTLASRADVGHVTDQLFGWNWSTLENGIFAEYQGYADQAASVWGYTHQTQFQNQINGLTSDLSPPHILGMAAVDYLSSIDPNFDSDLVYSMNVNDPDTSAFFLGSFLYKNTSPVPVPAAVWLFASGLVGLVGFARRPKA